MTEVVSVRFVSRGKKYFFAPNGIAVAAGDRLIVETAKGLDIGECAEGAHLVEDDAVVLPLRPVIRLATEADLKTDAENKKLEKEAFDICKRKISEHGLEMKLVGVECGFEGNKILFFFTSDGRVDFRELVKDLASVFRTRIELRQIGVRDETKMMGGLGICGRPYCCSQFLEDFEPVSTKMAKTQSMSLNPAKISGSCGRLMCCLRYEQEAYEDLVASIPKNGAFVQTVDGYGSVVQSNVLRQKIKVRMDGVDEQDIRVFDAAQVAAIPGGRPKQGEELPDILRYVPPVPEQEVPDDPWKAPNMFVSSGLSDASGAGEEKNARKPHEGGGRHSRNRKRHQGSKAQGGKQQGGGEVKAPESKPKPKENEQQAQAKQGGGQNKKSGGRNRRYRSSKPKNKGPQGGGSQSGGTNG